MNNPIRILLVDDSPYFLEAAREFLTMHESLTVVDVAKEEQEALVKSIEGEPDVILLDLNLAHGSGLELIPAFRGQLPNVKIIVLTMMDEGGYRAAVLQAGADGFVHKTTMSKTLVSAILETMGRGSSSEAVSDGAPDGGEQNDARFLHLAEHLPDLIYRYEFSPKRGFTYVSPIATAMTGYTPEEHYADPDLGFKLVHPDDHHLLQDMAEGKADLQKPLILRWVHKDGAIFWTEQRNVSIFDANGALIACEGVAREITERMRAEEAVKESQRQLSTLISNLPGLAYRCRNDADFTTEFVSDGVADLTGYPAEDFIQHRRHIGNMIHPDDLEPVSAQIQAALDENRSFELTYRIITATGEEKWVWEKGRGIRDSDGGVQALEGFVTDITWRKQADEKLRMSEDRYRDLVENSQELICTHDLDGNILSANAAATKMLGYEMADILKMNIRHILTTEAHLQFKDYIDGIKCNGSMSGIMHIQTASGEKRIWEYSNSIRTDGVSQPLVRGMARDVTERELARQALQENETRFASVIESAMDAVISVDDDQNIVLFNSAAERMFGCASAEALGGPIERFIPSRYRVAHKKHLSNFGRMGETGRSMGKLGTIHGLRTNGEVFPIEASISHANVGGNQLYTVILRDITERQQAEQTLRNSEAALRKAQQVSHVGSWAWHIPDDRLEWSDEMYRIFGIDGETFTGRLPDVIAGAIHPDDRPAVEQANLSVIQDRKPMPLEYRIVWPDGSVRTVWAEAGELILDDKGQPSLLTGIVQDITERKQAENEIRRMKDFDETLINNMTEGIVVQSAEGYFIYANPATAAMTGYLPEEFINVHWTNFFPVDQHEIVKKVDELRAVGGASRYEIEFLHKSGKRINLLVSGSPLFEKGRYNGSIAVFTDITERKGAEEKIQRQVKYLSALRDIDEAIASSLDAQTSLNRLISHTVRLLNVDAATVLLVNSEMGLLEYAAGSGFWTDAVRTASVKLGESYAGRAAMEQRLVQIPNLAEEPHNLLLTGFLAGESFTSYYAAPLIVKGQAIGVLEVFSRSVVERDAEWLDFFNTLAGQAAIAIDHARLIENLQNTNTDLEKRVEERTAELERANRAKDEFLATMSHELRTPLNSILGLSETLLEQQRDPLSEHQQKSMQIIESSGRHLLELINDVLDLSKIEAGKFEYYPQAVDVNSLCRSCMAFVREQAARKSISLNFEEEGSVSKIHADPRRVKQILVNLLTNAVKFTPEGGHVTLRVRANDDQDPVQFSVIDSGIGIAPQDLARLFQPFMQVDSALNRQFEGTGLGLALVQKLTDLHGGSVQVESEVGKGSSFTVHIPRGHEMLSQPETAETRAKPVTGGLSATLHEQKDSESSLVLLAEDNPANILSMSDYLEFHGLKVITAHDGLEAIHLAEEANPQIILMDIQMPNMDGLEAIRILRANPRFDATPIIALTALAMPGDRQRCLDAGANKYLSKPVSFKEMVKVIRTLLDNN